MAPLPALGELLELLYTARTRYRSVRLEAVLRHRPRLQQEAMDRAQQGRRGHASARLVALGPAGEPPEVVELRLRVWAEPPDRWRVEREDEHGTSLTVADGDTWWMYHPLTGAQTNAGDPDHQAGGADEVAVLLDPSVILGSHDLEPVAASGDAIEVRAVSRTDDRFFPNGLPFGADEHRLLVDPERGILRRIVSLFDGEELSSTELVEVAFDEELPPGTFRFEPPAGERVHSTAEWRETHRRVTIEEAAALARFPLFVVVGLEGQWRSHVLFTEARERPPVPATVHVHLYREDMLRQLTVLESAADATPTGWEHIPLEERGCFRVRDDDVQRLVLFEREGTRVQLLSNDLTVEELLDLARSVRKVEGPPGGGPSEAA